MSGAIGDDDDIGGIGPFGNEPSYVASLGRISGKLLTADLLRNGQDLTFRNAPTDADLLYLDVNNMRVGINTDAPLYDLHIDTDVRTTILDVTSQARIDNILINADGSFGSYTGPIIITSTDINSVIPMSKLLSDYLEIYNNRIDSINNNNIKLIPSGTGRIVAESSVQTYGNVSVIGTGAGNIVMGGNLRSNGTITVGDTILDTVTVNTDFTQAVIPGTDITYDLGKSNKRWAELNSPVWQHMDLILPDAVRVSDQILIDGIAKKISGIQSNEDVVLNPHTGNVYIESIKFNGSINPTPIHTITNPNAYGTPTTDNFGLAVAISGNYAVVGAPNEDAAGGVNTGQAYIIDVTNGTILHSLNVPFDATYSDEQFGEVVAIDGNYAIIGSPNRTISGVGFSGRVYVYDVTTGTLVHTVSNPTNAYTDYFGQSVGISGNYFIIGAPYDDTGVSLNAGKAYIYNVTTGTLVHTLTNPNPYGTLSGDRFGSTVAISGNYAVVGAPNEDDSGNNDSGKAYIYNVTTGTLVHTLSNPNADGDAYTDNFGYSVAISNSYIVVGVPNEDASIYDTYSGIVYVYDVNSRVLVHTINNPNAYGTPADDRFGHSVSISDNYIIASAYSEDDSGVISSGKTYIFNASTRALVLTVNNPNSYGTSDSDAFGYAIAISNDHFIVGAPYEDSAGSLSAGTVYIYEAIQSIIENLDNTPLTFENTGIGYVKFVGDNAVLIPAGDTASRPASPELGDTRWNTELGYLECFDGSVYVVSIGGSSGGEVTQDGMEDLGNIYTLMLG